MEKNWGDTPSATLTLSKQVPDNQYTLLCKKKT